MVEVLKILVGIPIWLVLFPFRLIVAILNIARLPRDRVVCYKVYQQWIPEYNQSVSREYLVNSSIQIHLGYFLVAFFRGQFQKHEVFQIEEEGVNNEHFKEDHKIISKTLRHVVLQSDIDIIRNDCIFLKH
jgi:hypothetical protein